LSSFLTAFGALGFDPAISDDPMLRVLYVPREGFLIELIHPRSLCPPRKAGLLPP